MTEFLASSEASVVHWVLIPVILFWAAWRWCGSVRHLAFVPWFIIVWLVLIHLQALRVTREDQPPIVFLWAVWATPFLVLGAAAVVLALLRHTPERIHAALTSPVLSPGDRGLARWTPTLTGLVIGIVVVYILDIGVGNVALFFLLTAPGSAAEAMVLRIAGLDSGIHPILTVIYSYGRALLFPVYAAVMVALVCRGSVGKAHAGLALGAIALFSLLTAAKAPLAFTMVGVLLSVYSSRAGRVPRSALVVLAVLALGLPAALYPLIQGVGGSEGVEIAASGLWRRITWVTSYTSAAYFDAFPDLHPHRGLASNRVLALLAGTEYSSTAEWVYARYLASSIPGGSANAGFFASFYADWGVPGVVLGGLGIGLVLAALQVFFDTRDQDALTTGARATCLVAVSQLTMTNFYSVALGRGMLTIPILLIVVSYVATGLGRHAAIKPPLPRSSTGRPSLS